MVTKNEAILLQERFNAGLASGGGLLRRLSEDALSEGARRILALYDSRNAPAIVSESMQLSDGGTTSTANISLPATVQRTVIREALSDLKLLELVSVLIDPNASTMIGIPYELRRPGTIANSGVVYERNVIPRSGIEQKLDYAYLLAAKLCFGVTNEVAFFSANSPMDWDAVSRNIESNARIIRELIVLRIANEIQRMADVFAAISGVTTDISGQLTGSASLVKTNTFPIVRPKTIFRIDGVQVGDTQNPMTVILNDAAIAAWDGTGDQTTGTYYKVENYNLGLIRLVDQAGDAVTPTATGVCTVTADVATNCTLFDLKIPSGVDLEDHLNGLLRAVGARKALMSAKRFVLPDFILMSPILNDTCTNARSFVYSQQRSGSGLTTTGDLESIKAIPAFSTNAPGVDLGDERILIGAVGTATYAVAKPFETGRPFEALGSNMQPIGEQIAYGEEYSAVHIPTALAGRLTSVIAYDSDARATAA
ncbi:MAG TPA: hypothetical protein PK018_05385 [Candidatus Competibacter sp.]|nr:hypothetical protein [Candidatus Competibacter sp.]HRW66206.1 hypothetical protein [Candidatus Competibacter sp.]